MEKGLPIGVALSFSGNFSGKYLPILWFIF